jgi:hypothetical protein
MEAWELGLVVAASALVGIVAIVLILGWIIDPVPLELKGKVVAITGGSSGIGLACAIVSTSSGYHGAACCTMVYGFAGSREAGCQCGAHRS